MKYDEPFNMQHAQWDQYREFHQRQRYGYHRFATGELINVIPAPNTNHRGKQSCVGVTTVLASNAPELRGFHLETPDGRKVPQAWLNLPQAGEHLVLDYTYGRAVGLMTYQQSKNDARLPVRFRGKAYAFWAGEGEPPVGRDITLWRPLDAGEKACAKQFEDQCRAYAGLHNLDLKPKPWRDDAVPFARVMHYGSLAGMADNEHRKDIVKRVCEYGIQPRRYETVSYLKITRTPY